METTAPIQLRESQGADTLYILSNGTIICNRMGMKATQANGDEPRQSREIRHARFEAMKCRELSKAFRELLMQKPGNPIVPLSDATLELISADVKFSGVLHQGIPGEAQLIVGFEFSQDAESGAKLLTPMTGTYHPGPDELVALFEPPVSVDARVVADGTTDFRIISMGAEVDFENKTLQLVCFNSVMLPYNSTSGISLTEKSGITVNSKKPFLLACGVQFYREFEGALIPLKTKLFTPLSVVFVANNFTTPGHE